MKKFLIKYGDHLCFSLWVIVLPSLYLAYNFFFPDAISNEAKMIFTYYGIFNVCVYTIIFYLTKYVTELRCQKNNSE